MEIQEQIHLKGRVWSPVSYGLEECFDAQAAAERIFPPEVWEKATLGASASSRKTTRKKSLLYLEANQAVDTRRLLDFVPAGWETQVSAAGIWAPLCQSIQDPVAESALIFQYTTVWVRMEHMSTDSVISFSVHTP